MAAQQKDEKSSEMITELTAVKLNKSNLIFEHDIPEYFSLCT